MDEINWKKTNTLHKVSQVAVIVQAVATVALVVVLYLHF